MNGWTKRIACCFVVVAGLAHGDVYLDLVEKAVGAYAPARVAAYLAAADRDGVGEHGFPRLAANMAVLVANGRRADLKPTLERMLDVCFRDAGRTKDLGRPAPRLNRGNDFSVKELVLALVALEKAGAYPKATTDRWRAAMRAVVAEDAYNCQPQLGNTTRAYNWCVFGAASEQARIRYGMGGSAAYVERYVADQIRWFDANGMYRDPHEPMVYDMVTRLQFAAILWFGYDGPSRAALEAAMLKSALPTLAMQSVTGEIPYGGRSNQFLHNETFYAALCEFYAAWFARRGDRPLAARFRAAARRATDALEPWLARVDVSHVKNRFPIDSGYGCEGYAYFDKYMVTMGSWACLARLFADDSVAPAADPEPDGVFVTSDHFHRVMMNAGAYTLQFDWNGDAHYDASGLGRIHLRGAPSALCLSTPAACRPHYRLDLTNEEALAIAPAGWTSFGLASADLSGVVFTNGAAVWSTRVAHDHVEMTLVGPGPLALRVPLLVDDGGVWTMRRDVDPQVLEADYDGWTCRYWTSGAFTNLQRRVGNRNGHYLLYEARGTGGLKVFVKLAPRVDARNPKQGVLLPRDPARVAAIAAALAPQAELPCPFAADRAAWGARAAQPGATAYCAAALREAAKPDPELPDDLYFEFSRNGNRRNYESPYFARLDRLQRFTLAECLEGKGRFLGPISRTLEAILAEPAWTLPAHDRSLEIRRGVLRGIDLFSAERAWGVALTLRLLAGRLDADLAARARAAAMARVVRPYLAMARMRGAPWVWWPASRYNWNRVCHAGCCCATLLLCDRPVDRADAIHFAERSLPAYLSGFGDDGYCAEGIGYWNYGFGNHVLLGLYARAATGGAVDLLADPRHVAIAAYSARYPLDGTGLSPLFADGGGRPCSYLQGLAAGVWPAAFPNGVKAVGLFENGGGSAWPEAAMFLARNFGLAPPAKTVAATPALADRDWFPSSGVLLSRVDGGAFAVALKPRNPVTAHAHGDAGSYCLASDGRIVAGDSGGEVYTSRTFSSRRFESKVLNSYGHPVPLVDGQLQVIGNFEKSEILSTDFTPARDELVVDLTKAYPQAKRLVSLVRTFAFDRVARTFTVKDVVRFSAPAAFEDPIVTTAPALLDGCYDVRASGGAWTLAEESIENPGRPSPRRIAVRFTEPVLAAEVVFVIRPPASAP